MKLLKFSRPGCSPCKIMENYLNDKEVSYQSIDVYEDAELANKFGIQSVPVLILLDEQDDVVDQVFGADSDELEQIINTYKGEN
jgi:thioredoxin 1